MNKLNDAKIPKNENDDPQMWFSNHHKSIVSIYIDLYYSIHFSNITYLCIVRLLYIYSIEHIYVVRIVKTILLFGEQL
jgi:hypothetical protein